MNQARLGRGSFHRGLALALIVAHALFTAMLGLTHQHAVPTGAGHDLRAAADAWGSGPIAKISSPTPSHDAASHCALCAAERAAVARLATAPTGVTPPDQLGLAVPSAKASSSRSPLCAGSPRAPPHA